MERITYYDNELGSFLLNERFKELTERDLINIIGIMEDGQDNIIRLVESIKTNN